MQEHNAAVASTPTVISAAAEPREPKDLQTLRLREAERLNGRLTVSQAVKATGRSFGDGEKCLREMVASGYVDVCNEPGSGVVVYVFEEMK